MVGEIGFTRNSGLKTIVNRLRIYGYVNYRLVERLREGMNGFS